jgi:hypothetical protein
MSLLYLKRVISKRDGCEYLKQVPSIDGSEKNVSINLFDDEGEVRRLKKFKPSDLSTRFD